MGGRNDRPVVVPANAGADARDVGPVEVGRDGGVVSRVPDALDLAWWSEPAHLAGRVLPRSRLNEAGSLLVERDAEDAPRHVVVDRSHVAGSPDLRAVWRQSGRLSTTERAAVTNSASPRTRWVGCASLIRAFLIQTACGPRRCN